MAHFICSTCGTQFAESDSAPASCTVCMDERQFIGKEGQRWTTLDALRHRHRNAIQRLEPGLYGVGTVPDFAIGQRALLLRSPSGNVLWDCIALLDDATMDVVAAFGGLAAIAISHPHYYTTMVEWAHAFGCNVYLHADDREWVMRPDPVLRFWEGDTHSLGDIGANGLTLVRCGGHFEGGTVLHWKDGAEKRGALLTGDTVQVVMDRGYVSFMRSYPNLIPLSASRISGITAALEPFAFDRLYGAWWDRHIDEGAKRAVADSARRYVTELERPAITGHSSS
ncbi:MAG: MBL fold metallo-hydrolase [Gemmatimonadaceae bacterium]